MITLNTIIYEGNFVEFLNSDNWFFNFKSKFISKKIITVNNLSSIDLFLEKVQELKKIENFEIFFVENNLDMVLEFFKLNINKSQLGYYYTIPYFTSLFYTNTEYFFNVASDCMDNIFVGDEFFELSFKELNNNPLCLTTMISWYLNNAVTTDSNSPHFGRTVADYEESETKRILKKDYETSDNFNIRYNFTDQFFLGRTDVLKQINYNVDENISSKYYPGPSYGGNCYEKRMVGFNIINNKYNFVYKGNNYFIHKK
jgi:hypothetical protein